MSRFSFVLLLLLTSCSLFSCNSFVKEDPVSKKEALQLANAIESSIGHRKVTLVNGLLDPDVFFKRIEQNSKASLSRATRLEIKRSLAGRTQLGAEIVKAIGTDGFYRLLRSYERAGKQHLLFRLYGSSGINYHDFELVKVNRQVKAADIFIYFTGELFSTTMGDLLEDMEGVSNASETATDIKKIKQLMNEKNYDAALQAHHALPEEIKHQKVVMMIKVQICSGLNDKDAYIKAIEEFQQQYRDQSNLPLLLIDAYWQMGKYEQVLQTIDQLDRLVGTDPFLDYLRALTCKALNDMPRYKEYSSRVAAHMPSFGDGVFEWVNACIVNKDYEGAKQAVIAYRKQPSFNQQVFTDWLNNQAGLPQEVVNAGVKGS